MDGRYPVINTPDPITTYIIRFAVTQIQVRHLRSMTLLPEKPDATSMQHDVDYSVCANQGDPKGVKDCKNKADRRMVKALDEVPYKDGQWGHRIARNTINTKQKLGLGTTLQVSPSGYQKKRKKPSSKELENQETIRRDFTRRRVIIDGIDEIWASDLVEMQKFTKWNKGYCYLLMVIDVFSKYGWIVPLKDKRGETIAQAFEKMFESTEGRRVPKYLWTGNGKECYNKGLKELLATNKVTLYSTENEESNHEE